MHRRAFTLIQLIVVLAILGFLMALLVPAIQRVREAAARTQTVNNLRQIGIAVHNFEGTFKKMPPAFASTDKKVNDNVVGYGAPPGGITKPQTIYVHIL